MPWVAVLSEGKQGKVGRGIARLLIVEGLAGAGLAHMLLYAPADSPYTLYFLYNAVAFLLLYLVVYLFKWFPLPGFLRFLLTPINIFMHAGLLMSTFLWVGYGIFMRFPREFPVFAQGAVILLLFWALLYLVWFRYVLASSHKYVPLGPLMALTMMVAAGGLAGFFLGRFAVERWAEHIGSDSLKFMVWVMAVLIGASGAGFLAPKPAARREASDD